MTGKVSNKSSKSRGGTREEDVEVSQSSQMAAASASKALAKTSSATAATVASPSKQQPPWQYPLFFALLMFQFGLQPLINKRYISYNNPVHGGFSKVTLCIVTELCKIIIVLILFNNDVVRDLKRITLWNSLKFAAAPAIVYTLQNFLVESGRELTGGLVFNVLNQTKILSTAICMYVFFGRKQSNLQIVAIILVLFAAILLTAGDKMIEPVIIFGDNSTAVNASSNSNPKEEVETSNLGIIFVLIASMTSGVASALCHRSNEEKLPLLPNEPTTAKQQRSSYTCSAEMAIYQIIIPIVCEVARLVWILYTSGEPVICTFNFTNWTFSALFPPIVNACGGIVVGLFSLLDNGQVKKSFALIAGLFAGALAEFFVKGTPITQLQICAGCIVGLSLYLHTAYPYKAPVADDKKKS